jgi:hypothetical protein
MRRPQSGNYHPLRGLYVCSNRHPLTAIELKKGLRQAMILSTRLHRFGGASWICTRNGRRVLQHWRERYYEKFKLEGASLSLYLTPEFGPVRLPFRHPPVELVGGEGLEPSNQVCFSLRRSLSFPPHGDEPGTEVPVS